MLGGSLYYVIAGVLILIAAFLVLRGSSAGIGLFWLVLLGTLRLVGLGSGAGRLGADAPAGVSVRGARSGCCGWRRHAFPSRHA